MTNQALIKDASSKSNPRLTAVASSPITQLSFDILWQV